MSKDYYKILGVSRNASRDEIKKAYRELAHQYHPDKKGGDEKKFKEINEAYQVLSDEQKRQQYDQFGTTFEGFQGGPGWGWNFSGGKVNWEDILSSFGQSYGGRGYRINLEDLFSDIFGDIFSGASWHKTRSRGKNVVVDMEINLEDILKGIEKEIRLEDLNIKLNIKPKISRKVIKEIKKMIKKFDKK